MEEVIEEADIVAIDVPLKMQAQCVCFGRELYERKRGGDQHHRRADGSAVSIAANVSGKLAECAFYLRFKPWVQPPDFRITRENDQGIDFTLPSEETVDVKEMGRWGYEFNPLRFPLEDETPEGLTRAGWTADIGCMAWPRPGGAFLVGWTDKLMFLGQMKRNNFGYGERHTVPWRDLESISSMPIWAEWADGGSVPRDTRA